jgi:hypothetical protein
MLVLLEKLIGGLEVLLPQSRIKVNAVHAGLLLLLLLMKVIKSNSKINLKQSS